MKKLLPLLLCLALIALSAHAAPTGSPEPLKVASPTRLSGAFFTDLWGINTADIDVRALVHGYSTVAWTKDGEYDLDPTVVKELTRDERDGWTIQTYEINRGLTFSDGTPINARDYVFSLLLLCSPEIRAIGGMNTAYSHILGYEEYALSPSSLQANIPWGETRGTPVFSGVRLLDERRFSISIKTDYQPYFYELAMTAVQPYPMHVLAPGCGVADGGDGAYITNLPREQGDGYEDQDAALGFRYGVFSQDMLEKTILDSTEGYLSYPKVSCGPYTLETYDRETGEAAFARNPKFAGDYSGRKPVIGRLTFGYVKVAEILPRLQDGSLDLVNKTTDGLVIQEGIRQAGDAGILRPIAFSDYERIGYGFIGFACESGAAQFAAVRKAVALSVDAKTFTQLFTQGFGEPVYGYYGHGQWMTRRLAEERPQALDILDRYEPNLERARRLLEEGGWTLDETGGPFAAGTGTVRYKKLDSGDIIPLSLRFAKLRGNRGADILLQMLRDNLAALGFRLEIAEVDFPELLSDYYRERPRQYDMYFLATNFAWIFDPYYTYHTGDEYQGVLNTSGLRDAKLMDLAWRLRNTDPGDRDTYLSRWLDFQDYWNEVLPTVPLYSNTYYDFFTARLTGYEPDSHWNWSTAILYASFAE